MTLNSIFFIFTCLPVLLFLYRFIPEKYRNLLLLIASILFYAWGEPLYIFLLLLSSAYTFLISQWLDDETLSEKQRKNLFVQAIAVHVFLLLYLKYYDFILDGIRSVFHLHISYRTLPQPLGLSFYTFMILSYIIDVYTHKTKAEKDPITFGVYVLFFPKLIMGPIERFHNMKEQIQSPRQDISLFASGVERFLGGLAKKVLLADTIGILWGEISGLPLPELSVLTAWIGALAYTLQIYFDFSGYSDMAIGIGNMFGFQLMENFNYPYIAHSITDFWRRWHISLSQWFRDYIYIPLGGNRVPVPDHVRNIMIVWFLTGLWHGANWTFIIWGLYYGCLLLLEKYVWKDSIKKLPVFLQWLITFVLIMIGWVFFASPDISQAFTYLKVMFCFSGNALLDTRSFWYLLTYGLQLLLGLICMLPVLKHLTGLLKEKTKHGAWFLAIAYLIVFMLSVSYLLSQTYQSFLYTQF